MSTSGSSAQFGNWQQQSLGPDFDRYVGERRAEGSQRYAREASGARQGATVAISANPSKVPEIAASGEIRNGFAPGAKLLHSGHTYEDNRINTEEALFGVPQEASHEKRPVYGYLEHAHDRNPGPYGHAVLDVHPNPRRSVTTNLGDSLDRYLEASRNNYYNDLPESYDAEEVGVEDLNEHHEPWPGGEHGYREVQVHGGPINLRREVTRAHLFRDHYNTDNVDVAATRLREKRVPTTVYRRMEYQPTLNEEAFGVGKTGWVNEEAYRRTPPRRKP